MDREGVSKTNLSKAVGNARHKDDDRESYCNRNTHIRRSVGSDGYRWAHDG